MPSFLTKGRLIKQKINMKKLIPSYIRVPLVFLTVFAAAEYFLNPGEGEWAFAKFPMLALFLIVFLFLLIAIEVVVDAVEKVTYHLMTDEQKAAYEAKENKFLAALTKSKDIDHEEDVMLDHDYDGIKELDNVLPPWWVGLFYASIVFAIIYLVRFEVIREYDQAKEYDNEIAAAKIEIDEYLKTAPDVMDKEKVTLLTDAAEIAKGKEIFTANCVACHRADGGGQIGPNLTDEQWIFGGDIKSVFNIIMEGGREGKGMVSWKATIKPSDIQKVASYVLSLQGTNPPNPKAPEGDFWKNGVKVEGNAPAVQDTTNVIKDTKVVAQK